jgi:adenylate kinase family enzyme
MARIVILGCAGSGKTTLARQLGERAGAPVICLDSIWQSHRTEKDVPAFRSLVKKAHAGEEWISDGNFALVTFDIRLPRATVVIWLERPRLICIWSAITRVFKRQEVHQIGKLAEVLAFIWNFDQVNRPRIEATRLSYGSHVPILRLSSRQEIAGFLSSYHNDTTSAMTPRRPQVRDPEALRI